MLWGPRRSTGFYIGCNVGTNTYIPTKLLCIPNGIKKTKQNSTKKEEKKLKRKDRRENGVKLNFCEKKIKAWANAI